MDKSKKTVASKPNPKNSKKDKLDSIRESLCRLNDQKLLYAGNKRGIDSIERIEKRLLDEMAKIKQY